MKAHIGCRAYSELCAWMAFKQCCGQEMRQSRADAKNVRSVVARRNWLISFHQARSSIRYQAHAARVDTTRGRAPGSVPIPKSAKVNADRCDRCKWVLLNCQQFGAGTVSIMQLS